MARPREFDEGAVLDAAVRCFWTRGYAATTVRDLAREMDLTGASLYNAFGDKRGLYHRALHHYVDQSLGDRVKRFEGLPPRAAIGAFFDEIVERSLADRRRKGCMLMNAALEVAPHDAEFRGIVAQVLRDIEGFFLRCVVAGQAAGTITAAQPAEDIARLLLSVLAGLRLLTRARPERTLLEGAVRPLLDLLDGAPQRFM